MSFLVIMLISCMGANNIPQVFGETYHLPTREKAERFVAEARKEVRKLGCTVVQATIEKE